MSLQNEGSRLTRPGWGMQGGAEGGPLAESSEREVGIRAGGRYLRIQMGRLGRKCPGPQIYAQTQFFRRQHEQISRSESLVLNSRDPFPDVSMCEMDPPCDSSL